MSVPFESLGPGQVGRAVFQVIGKDGPIANPANIRYLPLSDAPAELASGASQAAVGVALGGMNLVASAGALVVSAETLRQVHLLHARVDALSHDVTRIDAKLDAVLAKVSRIDARVAEGHLKSALEHLLRRAVGKDTIDVQELLRIQSDLRSMFDAIEGWQVGSTIGLRLATDTSDRLRAVCSVLAALRSLMYAEYNLRVAGNPTKVLSFRDEDYFLGLGHTSSLEMFSALFPILRDGRATLLADIDSHFSFSDANDQKRYQELFDEAVFDPAIEAMHEADSVALAIAADVAHAAPEGPSKREFVSEYLAYWLYETDAGLLWRTYVECLLAEDGYFSERELRALPGPLPESMTFAARVDADEVARLSSGATPATPEPARLPPSPRERFAALKR